MLVRSARAPSRAAPTPPSPKARPKNSPEMRPTFPGTSSWAYTRMAEKAEDSTSPMMTVRAVVQASPAYGRAREKGSTPRMEAQMTRLRPMRSPMGPPSTVPAAAAPRYRNRCSWALRMPRLNLAMR